MTGFRLPAALLLAVVFAAMASGCANTIRGAGDDLRGTAHAIGDAVR